MSSNICEDAGLLHSNQNEAAEFRRRLSSTIDGSTNKNIQQREERRRTSSVRSEIPEFTFKSDSIIISPEDIPDEYEHNEDFPGLFLLFNHEEFTSHDIRKGTEKDQNDLVDCLSRLRYEVRKELLYKDYTKKQIEEELNKSKFKNM